MCMQYNHDGRPAYHRLCYRTPWRGCYIAVFAFESSINPCKQSMMPGPWVRESKQEAIADQRTYERASGLKMAVEHGL